MSDKLKELTDRLYKDGVEKAREEAAAIVADAEARREEMLRDARREADAMVEKARKEAEDLRSRVDNELSLAARQAEDTLKQRLADLLSGGIVDTGTADALNDTGFLKNLILSVTESWAREGTMPEISLVLGDEMKTAFDGELKSALADRLKAGLEVRFSGRVKAGFQIVANDGTYRISFTDDDFSAFFRSFVRDATRNALFGN